jgi:UDP-glucose-4-epimerase GalE
MQRSNKNKNHILVTGGAGYIGSHTCKALFNNGYKPVVYDNLSQGHRDFVRWGPFEKGDICDIKKLNKVMRKYDFVAVIHFAAHAYVGESVLDPKKYYTNNVFGSLTLFNAMLQNNIDSVVFSSTCATYGSPKMVAISEEVPQLPLNPYGNSKLMIERILKDYDSAYNIKSISLRYFNAAGADPDGDVGEDHFPETHLIPAVYDSSVSKKEIVIFGNDYETNDGTCVRDYVHVSDLAEAHLLSLKYLLDHKHSDQFNLGLNRGYSVLEIINAIKKYVNIDVTTKFGQRRIGDPAFLVSNASKAEKILGWKPNFDDIEIIIDHSWNWHKKRFTNSK